jgi:hypothetical protein
MPLMPMMVAGRLRLVVLPAGAGAKEIAENAEENVRRAQIAKRRTYTQAAQYDAENDDTLSALGKDPLSDRLPEHLRLHAYSTQIDEAIAFICDQLSEAFSVLGETEEVTQVLLDAMRASDQLTGTNDDDEPAIDDVLYDALVAGDVAVELRWDPVSATVFYEFWESEQIRFDWSDRRTLKKVVREEVIWVFDPAVDGQKQVVERIEYTVEPNGVYIETDGMVQIVMECRKATFWDDEEDPRGVEWLGVPFIPWSLLRVSTRSLRALRGESIITDQAMSHADRYNANEQVAWLIARYNSHGNLAVVGDAAHLKLTEDSRVAKDVADVLTFPGGTNVESITLPTDPQMIEHQRGVLAEAIYASFGLTRVEPDTIGGLGSVSGYALEILNRKTEGTFRRIRRNWVRDLKTLFSMTLDLHAYRSYTETWQPAPDQIQPEPIPAGGVIAFWQVDPDTMWPKRDITIRLGSGYIVDDVIVRDDYVAGLISRREALRRRGLKEEQIDQIEAEIAEETPPTPEAGVFGLSTSTTKAGATVSATTRR